MKKSMSSLQQIIDRNPDDGTDILDDPGKIKPDDADIQSILSIEKSVPPASLQETAGVPCPDKPASTDKSILIVEDEGVFAEDLKETLHSLGYKVDSIEKTGAGAVRYVKTARPDLILMDINLGPGMDGIDAAEKILSYASIPIIYLTAYADPSLIERAKTTSPYGYILKPFDVRELRTAIEIAFYKHKNDLQLKKAYGELEQHVAERTEELERTNQVLLESEERYRNIIEDQTEFICRFTPDGTLTFVNNAYCRYFGLNRYECIRKQQSVVLPPDDNRKMREHIASLTRKNPVALIRHRIIMPSGEVRWQRWSDRAIFDERGTITEYQSVGRDITDVVKAEEALRESEEHYRQLVELSPNAILVLNDSKIMEINSAAVTLFGASSPGQLLGGSFMPMVHPDFLKTFEKWIRQVMDGKKPVFPLEQKIVQLNGTIRDIEVAAVPITCHGRRMLQVITRDITQRKILESEVNNQRELLEKQVQERTIDLLRANEQLKMEITERKAMQEELTVASDEKDLLLREIHHRVKNNLQLIIGLIDMTKMRTHDTAIAAVLTDIMAKIHTMGLIHTRLYETKRFDKINMKQQVAELVNMTSGFYIHEHCTIDFTIDCAEIYLPVDRAMPSALALNEVLSNIHKHAFKGRRSGVVKISSYMKNTKLRFVIHDNGVGLPKGFDIEQSNRLGLKLMRALVEQQLHGSVLIKSENGTQVVIEIPLAQAETDHGKSTCS